MCGRFEVKPGRFGEFSQHTLRNEETGEEATIIDGCGTTLQALKLRGSGGTLLNVVDGHETPASLRQRPVAKAGAPLIPFANRVHGARYRFQGQEYVLRANWSDGNAIHGFLYGRPWEVAVAEVDLDAARLTCEYRLTETDFAGYPFQLLARLDFELSSEGFRTVTTITNTGRSTLPLTVGFHPYLTVRPTGKETIDGCRLVLPAAERLRLREMIPTGEVESVAGTAYDFRTAGLIGGLRFDDGFTGLAYHAGIATVKLYDEASGCGVELWQDESYRFLQVYTPPDRVSIAIEPMSGAADAFNNEIGLTILKPGSSFKGVYGVKAIDGHGPSLT